MLRGNDIKVLRKILLLLIFLLIPSAYAINPFVKGYPVKVEWLDNKILVATRNGFYMISVNGSIERFLRAKSITDFNVSKDMIVITQAIKDFPNVNAYNIVNFNLLWSFEPKMNVFDMNLLWQEMQSRSWRVKCSDTCAILSGHKLYLLNRKGKEIAEFKASNDLWDVQKIGKRYYVASQDGNIYVLDENLKLIEKRKVCKDFLLINPVSNQTMARITRSVWQIEGNAMICEDGNIVFLDSSKSYEVKRYSKQMLHDYYSRHAERESGYGSELFKNLKIKRYGNNYIVYANDVVAVFENKTLRWKSGIRNFGLDVYNNRIYVITRSYEKGKIEVYSLENGSKLDEFSFKQVECDEDGYVISVSKYGIFVASACEFTLLSHKGAVKWYIERRGYLNMITTDNSMIFFSDKRGSMLDDLTIFSVIGVKDNKLWYYSLPNSMRKKGYIKDIKVFANKIALLYSTLEGKDRVIVLDENGNKLGIFRISDRKYAGILDNYLLNKTVMQAVKNFSFQELESIPAEIIEGRLKDAVEKYGREAVIMFMNKIRTFPLNISILMKFKSIDLKHIEELRYWERIRSIDVCDYNGDGTEDLILNGEGIFVVRDGKNMKEIKLIDRDRWKYENDFNRKLVKNFTASWFDEDYVVLCMGDVNNDRKVDLLLIAPRGFYRFMESYKDGYKIRWEKYYKNLQWDGVRKIEDIDGDGISDFIAPFHRPNMPPILRFISTRNHAKILELTPGAFSLKFSDLDNDGKKEIIIVYDDPGYGAKILIKSRTLEWSYEKLKEFWEVWDTYGNFMPLAVIEDMSGDNVKEIAIAAFSRNDKGVKLLIFDVKNNKLLKMIDLEKSEFEFEEYAWTLSNSVEFKDMLFLSAPDLRRRDGRVFVYNISSDRLEAIINMNIGRIFVNNKIMLVGKDGDLMDVKKIKKGKANVRTKNEKVSVSTDADYFLKIYVDGILAAAKRTRNIGMRLTSGKHELRIDMLDRNGFERIEYVRVNTFNPSSTSLLNLILLISIAVYAIIKVIRWKWLLKQ